MMLWPRAISRSSSSGCNSCPSTMSSPNGRSRSFSISEARQSGGYSQAPPSNLSGTSRSREGPQTGYRTVWPLYMNERSPGGRTSAEPRSGLFWSCRSSPLPRTQGTCRRPPTHLGVSMSAEGRTRETPAQRRGSSSLRLSTHGVAALSNGTCFSGGHREEPSGRAIHQPTLGRGRDSSSGAQGARPYASTG